MSVKRDLDCVVIGYNEVPFDRYESLLRQYGEESEVYRDLKFSFVELGGRKHLYTDLMNHAVNLARSPGGDGGVEVFKSGDMPNLAAAYLTNFLNRRGLRTHYINLFQNEKDRLAEMLKGRPLCVAITTTFYVLNLPVVEMIEFIRAHDPDVKIVVGGPLIANHARNNPEPEQLQAALGDLGADIYVVEGQGELTLARILECLKQGGGLETVPNIIYAEGGRLHRTGEDPEANSMNQNIIDWETLAAGMSLGPTLQTRTARSCAFKCSFCNYPTRAGKLSLTSLEALEEELDSMKRLGGVQNVVFIDDTFNVPLPRFKDICRLMIRKNYGFNWFSYFRCSNSDEEAVELMAASGCKGVFLGIESGSPSILENMSKAAAAEQYRKGIQMLKKHGILTFGSFITGFPGETEATVRETLDFIRETRPDFYRTQLWYCEPGTPIVLQRDRFGIDGDGFVWTHDTMESLEAMDWIEKIFLTVEDSVWLPQWSFDFWIIPYLIGKGVRPDDLRDFLRLAQKLMALGIAYVPEAEKTAQQEDLLRQMVSIAGNWTSIS